MSWTERRKNALLLAVVSLTMIAAAELALRAVRPQPTYSSLAEKVGSYYAPSDYNTFQLRKGYVGVEPSMEHPGTYVDVKINSDGFRGPELAPDKAKILVLGDSYTFGVYVNNDETYPAVLERLIRGERPRYQVINAGYADGWDTDQHYVWLRRNLKALNPEVVILGVFLGNDILGISPDSWKEIDEHGLPGKWLDKDRYVNESGMLKDRSAKANTTVGIEGAYRVPVLRDSHLFILAGRAFDRLKNRITGEERFRDDSFQHVFGVYSEEFTAKEALFLKLLGSMKRLCEDNGARFVVALLPVNFMVESDMIDRVLPGSRFRGRESVYYARLQGLLADQGIPAVNIESAMKRAGPGPYFPSNGEVHFNPRGHSFTAERLYEFLSSRNYLK